MIFFEINMLKKNTQKTSLKILCW